MELGGIISLHVSTAPHHNKTLSILRLSKPKKFEVAEKKEYKAPRTPAPPFVDRLYSCVSCQGPLESVKRVPPLGGITEKAPVRRQEKAKVQIEKYIGWCCKTRTEIFNLTLEWGHTKIAHPDSIQT